MGDVPLLDMVSSQWALSERSSSRTLRRCLSVSRSFWSWICISAWERENRSARGGQCTGHSPRKPVLITVSPETSSQAQRSRLHQSLSFFICKVESKLPTSQGSYRNQLKMVLVAVQRDTELLFRQSRPRPQSCSRSMAQRRELNLASSCTQNQGLTTTIPPPHLPASTSHAPARTSQNHRTRT